MSRLLVWFVSDDTGVEKQIRVNYPRSSWAALYMGSSEIVCADYPDLQRYDWYPKVVANFEVMMQFFEAISTTVVQPSSVAQLKAKPEGVYSLNLVVHVETLYDYWQNYLLFECTSCHNQVHICSCTLNPRKNCALRHSNNIPDQCSICGNSVIAAHYLFCNFSDSNDQSIRVRFSTATINLFFSKFPSDQIVSDARIYTDFLNTLKWHTDRYRSGEAFLQSIVLQKKIQGQNVDYVFVSGLLTPVLDDKGYVKFQLCLDFKIPYNVFTSRGIFVTQTDQLSFHFD